LGSPPKVSRLRFQKIWLMKLPPPKLLSVSDSETLSVRFVAGTPGGVPGRALVGRPAALLPATAA
jgi:hypothetical protein